MNRSEEVATLVYAVKRPAEGWELSEETVPESESHRSGGELLKTILEQWAVRTGNGARIVAGLGLRWVPEDARIGVDPDVAVLLPAPPVEKYELDDYYMWLPDHPPPLIACEIVSRSNAIKDYSIAPEKYAASGTQELWIFDPKLAGKKVYGGPLRLQIWRREDGGAFRQIYAGDGPARSPALDAWLVPTNENRMLRITSDEAATDFWLTGEEAERAAKEAALAAKEAALAKVAELEARLAKLEGRSP